MEANLSTESIASRSRPLEDASSCAACGAPLADDQRYCLQCGERRNPMSSVLLAPAPRPASATPPTPPTPPGVTRPGESPSRSNAVITLIAGVGVLLLAMGVGVLIGRAGSSKSATPPSTVITVSAPAGTGGSSSGASESFTGGWPSSTSGYTVQLRTLPLSGTSVSALEAAKTAATSKGAKNVGALKSSEYRSLTGSNYVIYSGVFHTKAEAEKALTSLKKSFPSASVIAVNNSSGSSSQAASSSSAPSSSTGSSESHPAPPTVLKGLSNSHGKSYEEKSKNLPDVVETG